MARMNGACLPNCRLDPAGPAQFSTPPNRLYAMAWIFLKKSRDTAIEMREVPTSEVYRFNLTILHIPLREVDQFGCWK